MRFSRLAAALGVALLTINVLGDQSPGTRLGLIIADNPAVDLMKNVSVAENTAVYTNTLKPAVSPTPEPETILPTLSAEEIKANPTDTANIRETTIQGGMSIKNETDYEINVTEFLSVGPQITLPADGPQILIMHTHGSEAYTPAGLDRYEESDNRRTEDKEYNVIRIGDELTTLLEGYGLNVLHDREIHDYPSYTGSYTRSGQAVENYLKENPGIAVVIDLHRDALDSNGIIYKTMAEESGVCASQIMMLTGSNASGLQHDNWQKNLSLALYLQQAVNSMHPTLMRPVTLVKERYNMHLTNGSIILEVGSSGNTLQEALAAIRLFADAAGPALHKLIEQPLEE